MKQLALQSAKSISLMPEIQDAIDKKELETKFRPITEQVRDQVNAADIIVENREVETTKSLLLSGH
ncbi:hypothetical protein [Psychrobacillus sp. BM2]|uniref:hypothetical protein n=1 Tax=Psychrobacillus sp. BM2 TaxID=3400421 RepID=UPI003B02D233